MSAPGLAGRAAAWLALVTAVVVMGTAAHAAAGEDTWDVGGKKGGVGVGGTKTTPGESDDGSSAGPVLTIPKPYKEYKYIPACMHNGVEDGGDDLCGMATTGCPDEGDIKYRVYTRQHDANGDVSKGADWEPAGVQCRGPDDPPEGGPVVITTADIAEEAFKAAPATTVHVEPATASYVNVPNNFYADSDAVDATVEVLGQTIGLRFEPAGFTWSFGDGVSGSGAGLKGAAVGAPGAVEHAYRRSGTPSVTLSRTFEVTYTLPGGVTGTLPAPGVSNTSAPYALTIGEIQSLVTRTR